MNTWAVVSASPRASCGWCDGRPSAPASSPSDSVAAAVAVALVQPHEPEHAGVDHRAAQAQALAAQRRSQEAALDRGNVDDRDPARHHRRAAGRSRARAAARRRGRRRASRARGSRPRSSSAAGAPALERRRLQLDAAVLDRDGGERDDLVPARVQAAELEVDGAVARRRATASRSGGKRARLYAAAPGPRLQRRLSSHAEAQLGGDAPLNRRHRAERLLEMAARQRAQLRRGSRWSSGSSPARSCST